MDLQESQARRRALREQRRRTRRRRLYGLIGTVVGLAAVVAVLVSSGAGKPKPATATNLSAATPATRAGTGKARHHRRRKARSKLGPGGTTVLGKPTGIPGTVHVPVLMYHVIAPPPAGAPYPGLYVPAPEFAEEMQALKDAGWHAVTLDQLRANWQHGVPLGPGKPIVITFDNGYHSQYANALPILNKLGWVADENIQLQGLPPSQGGMTTAEVRALTKAGWELDTQGISHADLVSLTPSELRYQVVAARKQLQRTYHVPVNWFCYPSGQYNAAVIAAVQKAGFVGSTTVVPGWAAPSDNAFALPRLRILNGTTGAQLLAQIAANENNSAPTGSYVTDSTGSSDD